MNPKISITVDAKNKAVASLAGLVTVGSKVDVEVRGLTASDIPDWTATDRFTGKSLRFRIVDENGCDLVRYPLVEKDSTTGTGGDTWTVTSSSGSDVISTTSGCFVACDTDRLRAAFRGIPFDGKLTFGVILDSVVDAAEYATGRIRIVQWSVASTEDPTVLPDWRATLNTLKADLATVESAKTAASASATEAGVYAAAASTSAGTASTNAISASNSASIALQAKDASVIAKNAAVDAKNESVAAQIIAEAAQEAAEEAASHYPYIDDTTGHWMVWEDGEWVDKGAAKGDTGDAATIAVHSTETLSAGSDAEVVNMGTSGAANFKFRIPRGADGTNGIAATVSIHSTVTGGAGSNANVENMGTSSNANFKFTIPKGDKGDKGDAGDPSHALIGETMKNTPNQKELTFAVKKIWEKLGGTFVMCFVSMCAFSDVSRTNEWWTVPPETLVGTVVDLGCGGVDTNTVKTIVNAEVGGTNTLVHMAQISDMETATHASLTYQPKLPDGQGYVEYVDQGEDIGKMIGDVDGYMGETFTFWSDVAFAPDYKLTAQTIDGVVNLTASGVILAENALKTSDGISGKTNTISTSGSTFNGDVVFKDDIYARDHIYHTFNNQTHDVVYSVIVNGDVQNPKYGDVSLTIPSSPKQSDWNVTNTTDLAYIKNKPNVITEQTFPAKMASAIDASRVVRTNNLGTITLHGTQQDIVFKDRDNGNIQFGANAENRVVFGGDMVQATPGTYYSFPWANLYGTNPQHEFALRSQITNKTDAAITGLANAAIAAAGCVVTNASGIIQLKGQYQPGIDFYVGGDLLVSWYRDYVFASGNMYYFPWSSAYGTDAAHDLALRSQIYVEKNDNSFGVLPLLQYGGKDAAGFWFSAINPLWAYYDTQLSKPLLKWGDDIVALESQIPTSATVEGWGFAKTSAIPTAYLASASATATSITVTPNTGAAVSLAVEYEYATRSVVAPASVTCVSGEIVTATGVSGTLNVVFPAEVANKSADFILRVVATGASQLGTLTITGGGTVTPEWLCDALTTTGKIAANKTTYIFFSRVAANTYVINAQEVK